MVDHRRRARPPPHRLARLETAIGIARPGGAVGRVGVPQEETMPASLPAFFGNVRIGGGPAPARAYIEELLPDILEGRIEPGKVFDRTVGLEGVPHGIQVRPARVELRRADDQRRNLDDDAPPRAASSERVGMNTSPSPPARVFITGSADGLGRAAAQTLLERGHEVVVHARNHDRLTAVRDLLDGGAAAVVGDLSDLEETRGVADQVNRLGPMDAVIHNAGVVSGPRVLPVNVVAPYLLTALIHRPRRLVYVSSGMHRGGRASLAGMDWSGHRSTGSYSDSKLFVTTLAAAVARLWTDVYSNAVDPGWVPTRMGGPGAPDDLRLGHLTQEWLATSDDPEARTSGGYWHHQRRAQPAPSVQDQRFQARLLEELARFTATRLVCPDPADARVIA